MPSTCTNKSLLKSHTVEDAENGLIPSSALQRNCRLVVEMRLPNLGFGAKQPEVGLSGGSPTSTKCTTYWLQVRMRVWQASACSFPGLRMALGHL